MKKSLCLVFFIAIVLCLSSTTIYDIQYTTVAGPDGTYPSPLDGQDVTVTGIVTGANFDHGENMYFMSDLEGGAWHGIYIYDFETGPALGDEVEVTGTVAEYYGLTELSYCTTTILSSGNTVPSPSVVSTINLVVPAQAESYEGCLVEVANVEVTEAQGEYGQWFIDDGTGECMVDDGFFYLDSVTPPIVITAGMTWDIIRGCLIYSFDEYSINPRTSEDLIEVASSPNNVISPQSEFLGCYPNPFNPETTAHFYLAEDTKLELNIYNIKGEKVRSLMNSDLAAGEHHITWNGKDDNGSTATSGIYFYYAESNNGDFTSVRKIILMK
jgi:FlgD Ig-like domain